MKQMVSRLIFEIGNGKIEPKMEGKIRVSELMSIINYLNNLIQNIEIEGQPSQSEIERMVKSVVESANKSVEKSD